MAVVEKINVLRLYKDLLKYSNTIVHSDKQYYLRRVRQEFERNKELTKPEDIGFYFQITKNVKDKLDFSKVPELKEADLEEQFIHGSGPGGTCVNKAHNCVLLKHKPTGLVVKVHQSREAHKNSILARESLKNKLDEHLNGEDSVLNQIKRIQRVKQESVSKKAAKRRELKKAFKEGS